MWCNICLEEFHASFYYNCSCSTPHLVACMKCTRKNEEHGGLNGKCPFCYKKLQIERPMVIEADSNVQIEKPIVIESDSNLTTSVGSLRSEKISVDQLMMRVHKDRKQVMEQIG